MFPLPSSRGWLWKGSCGVGGCGVCGVCRRLEQVWKRGRRNIWNAVLRWELPGGEGRGVHAGHLCTGAAACALPAFPVALGFCRQLWVGCRPLWGRGVAWPWGCCAPCPLLLPQNQVAAEWDSGQGVLSTPVWAGEEGGPPWLCVPKDGDTRPGHTSSKGTRKRPCGLWSSREPPERGMWCSRLSCAVPQECPVSLGSALGLGGQNPAGGVMGGTKCHEKEQLERAAAASLGDASHSLKGSG